MEQGKVLAVLGKINEMSHASLSASKDLILTALSEQSVTSALEMLGQTAESFYGMALAGKKPVKGRKITCPLHSEISTFVNTEKDGIVRQYLEGVKELEYELYKSGFGTSVDVPLKSPVEIKKNNGKFFTATGFKVEVRLFVSPAEYNHTSARAKAKIQQEKDEAITAASNTADENNSQV